MTLTSAWAAVSAAISRIAATMERLVNIFPVFSPYLPA